MTGNTNALWRRILGSLWFIPGTIVLGSVLLAALMVELSSTIGEATVRRWPRILGAGAEGSRGMLSAIASSMITVAGVTFSIVMVAVTQASAQYTPRILRNFMRDRANQVVLGAFVGIFAYCIVVLRTIRGGDEPTFVPSLAVLLGVMLAILGVGVLIFFVHHIATALQASTIVSRIARETIAVANELFPRSLEEPEPEEMLAGAARSIDPASWRVVKAPATGYIQSVDTKSLLRVASERRLVLRMERAVGEFVVEGMPVVSFARLPAGGGRDGSPGRDGDEAGALVPHYAVSSFRTIEQDAAFGVRQLVDIAIKALSPAVNDTTTAVTCVDYLGALLVQLANRRIEATCRGAGGELRLIERGGSFESLLRASFDEIRQNSGGNVTVLLRMLRRLRLLADETRSAERRALVREQVLLMLEVAERTVAAPYDRQKLRERGAEALAAAR